jgi:hypothetical protein
VLNGVTCGPSNLACATWLQFRFAANPFDWAACNCLGCGDNTGSITHAQENTE